jgi:hypothetical protein
MRDVLSLFSAEGHIFFPLLVVEKYKYTYYNLGIRENQKRHRNGQGPGGAVKREDSDYFFHEKQQPLRRLRGKSMTKKKTLADISKEAGLQDIAIPIAKYLRSELKDERFLQPQEDAVKLLKFPVQLYNCLEVPVLCFQEEEEFEVHKIRCTRDIGFRKRPSRKDWVWVWTGDESRYGALCGRILARVGCLLKLQDIEKDKTYRLALVRVVTVENGGYLQGPEGLVRVSLMTQNNTSKNALAINIRSITGMAHLVPEVVGTEKTKYIVNNRIDLKTFNEVY